MRSYQADFFADRAWPDRPCLHSENHHRNPKRPRVQSQVFGGVPYRSPHPTKRFKRKGLALIPHAVILIFFVNDPGPVPRLNPLTYTFRRHDYLLAVLFDACQRMRTRYDRCFTLLNDYSDLCRPDAPAVRENHDALHELVRLCRSKGIALYFVNYPELHQLEDYPPAVATEHIESIARETDTPFLDLLPRFQGQDTESMWMSPEDVHGNDKAAVLAADAINLRFGDALRQDAVARTSMP